jgi:hypothetical protein
MDKFSVEKEKEILLGDTGIGYHLTREKSWFEERNGLTVSAQSMLNAAIRAGIVGLLEEGKKVLAKASEWNATAEDKQEVPARLGAVFSTALRFKTRSLCTWLQKGEHDKEALAQYREHIIDNNRQEPDRVGVELTLVGLCDGEMFDDVRSYFDGSAAIFKPPGLANIKSESAMAFYLAQQHSKKEAADSKVVAHFLNANVNKWLSGGDAIRAGHWAKVLLWHPSEKAWDIVARIREFV